MSILARRGLFFSSVLVFALGFALNVQAQSVNLLANGSLETASGSAPANWAPIFWGAPTPTFSYPATGNSGTKGAMVTLGSNSTGDASWRPSAPVNVTPGATYTYSTWYNSNVPTEIDVEFISSTGAITYGWIADVPATGGTWQQLTAQFAIPTGVTKATPYHILFNQGALTIDDISLTSATTTPPPAPTLTFSANPTQINSGQSSTLNWSSTNATSCTASNGWTGTKALSGNQAVSPTATTTYVLVCDGAGGSVTQQVTIGVTNIPTPAPTLTFSANPTQINSGQSSTLSWNTTNATTCTASNGWTGTKATSGSQSVSPTATTTYALTCSGAGGNVTQQVTVNVRVVSNPAPTLTLTASSTSIVRGQSSTLTWSSTNATSCTASGSWSGTKATSGSQNVSPTANATYTLRCTGAGGSITRSATVTVTAPPTTFTEGMVSLTFDDAWSSQHDVVLPILNTAGLLGTFYLTTEPIQGGWIGYMTPAMVQAIAASNHEIAGHTVSHPHMTQLSVTAMNSELTNSKTYLQNLTGKTVKSFAYPYGEHNSTVRTRTQAAGYTSGRGTENDTLNTTATNKYNLKSNCIENATPFSVIKADIDKAKANKQWFILCIHEVNNTGDQYSITPAMMQQIIDYIKSINIKVVTVEQGRALMP